MAALLGSGCRRVRVALVAGGLTWRIARIVRLIAPVFAALFWNYPGPPFTAFSSLLRWTERKWVGGWVGGLTCVLLGKFARAELIGARQGLLRTLGDPCKLGGGVTLSMPIPCVLLAKIGLP